MWCSKCRCVGIVVVESSASLLFSLYQSLEEVFVSVTSWDAPPPPPVQR